MSPSRSPAGRRATCHVRCPKSSCGVSSIPISWPSHSGVEPPPPRRTRRTGRTERFHLFIGHASSLPRPPVWIGTMIEKGRVVGQGVGYCKHDCMQLRLHACPIACLPAAPSSSIVRPNWRSSGRQRLIQQSDLAARVTIEAKRNTPVRYGAADQAMQCHHRFVGPNASLLSRNSPDEVWPPVVTQCGRWEGPIACPPSRRAVSTSGRRTWRSRC